ncbi:MAG: hypothetical protein AB7H93_14090 [Vicinamibacterales bacterium]
MTGMPRRDFLWQALSVCGSTLVATSVADGRQAPASDRARQASTGYFADRADAVRAIGEAYLRQLGHAADRASILAVARGALQSIERGRDERGATQRLVRTVREDFARGRTVQLEGWILSRTEAEICTLTLLDA